MDGVHAARGRRRVAHAGQLLVLEDRLAAQHVVAGLHQHRGLEPHVVGPQQGHAGHGGAGLDRLDRGTGNREIQPALDRVHRPGGPLRRAMAGASPSRGKGRGVGPRAIDVNQPGGCLCARRGWGRVGCPSRPRRLFVHQRASPARRSCLGPGLLSGGHGARWSRRRSQVEGRLKRPAHCRPHQQEDAGRMRRPRPRQRPGAGWQGGERRGCGGDEVMLIFRFPADSRGFLDASPSPMSRRPRERSPTQVSLGRETEKKHHLHRPLPSRAKNQAPATNTWPGSCRGNASARRTACSCAAAAPCVNRTMARMMRYAIHGCFSTSPSRSPRSRLRISVTPRARSAA